MIDFLSKMGSFVFNCSYSVMSVLILLIRRNKVSIPRAKDKDIFLLMNGPSLNNILNEYGDALKHKTVMCVNMMAFTDDFERVKPQFYTIADIKFWQKMHNIDNNSFLSNEQKKWDMLSHELVKKTKWRMYLILPDLAKENKDLIHRLSQNKNIKLIFLNSGFYFKGFDSVCHKCWKYQLCVPELLNVLVLSLYISVLMRFNNIYLAGCDHTFFDGFHVDDNNHFYYEYKHSYDNNITTSVPYDSVGDAYSVGRILDEYAKLWKVYEELSTFSREMGSRVFNCTQNSLIDVFDRKCIKEVLHG